VLFKVIDGDGPGDRDPKQDQQMARDEFSWAIRDTLLSGVALTSDYLFSTAAVG